MTGPDLKPCPFCGGEPEIVNIDEGENAGGSCVCCKSCMASGNVEFERKENFVSNWNRRTAQPEVQAMIAAAFEAAAYAVTEADRACLGARGAWAAIRALTPADATAALEAIKRAERNKARREAAEWHHQEGWKLDEDAVPGAILAMLEPENEE